MYVSPWVFPKAMDYDYCRNNLFIQGSEGCVVKVDILWFSWNVFPTDRITFIFPWSKEPIGIPLVLEVQVLGEVIQL
jgi:hypothetical protein